MRDNKQTDTRLLQFLTEQSLMSQGS
jgi:hypothetical protein